MIKTSEFLAGFREYDEPLPLRAFKPKSAPDTPENSPQKWTTTLFDLTQNRGLQQELRTKNQHCGIYFVVNSGGDDDKSITRYVACFVENDTLPIDEQQARFDAAPLQPSIRLETRKSVHGHFLLTGDCSTEEWRLAQTGLIRHFDGDSSIINPSRVMRLPNFDHLHSNGNGIERKRIVVTHFEPERRYTIQQILEAFPPGPKPETVPQAATPPSAGPFETWDSLNAEAAARIKNLPGAKLNRKGWAEAPGRCHGSTDGKALFVAPDGAYGCHNKCTGDAVRLALGLPEKPIAEAASIRENDSEGQPQSEFDSNTQSSEHTAPPLLSVLRMADVEPENVRWLWQPYIALGKLTLLEGDPGIGKSWITAALAAAVSRGRGLSGMEVDEPANVLMLSAEDGLADTLRPRLDAVGADVERVFALNEPLTFDGHGLLRLEVAIIEYKPLLLTVDPLFAFTGGKVDIHRANECRTITARLALIAEKHGCAIVAVRHLGKSRGLGHALNAGIGSIDLVAAARSVLLAGKDPDDENKRAIAQIKSNLAPPGTAVGFTLRGGEFFWTGESDLTAERILSYAPSENERPALDEATEFLRDELSGGECDVALLKANSRRAGIQEITLRRAKERLGVKVRRQGFGKGGKWTWELPIDAQAAVIGAQKTDDEHLWANRDDKSTYSNDLTIDAHSGNSERLCEGDDYLWEPYREPTKAEWDAAAGDPDQWDRLVTAAEGCGEL